MPHPNPGQQDQLTYAGLHLGFRTERSAANLPQTAATPYFTVAGGRVAACFIGEVTTVVQAQATVTKLIHNPTVGTDLDLCTTLDITGDEVGTIYTLPAAVGSALIGAGQAGPLSPTYNVLKPGTVDLSTGASSTGATKWVCYWFPIDEGAYVAAA